jgi:hypothetical protein
MNEKGTWLTEESILQALEEAASRIRKRNLNFERLLLPGKDQRTLQVVDRGQAFGVERVRETGEQIRLCETALGKSDAEGALAAILAALVRWQQT